MTRPRFVLYLKAELYQPGAQEIRLLLSTLHSALSPLGMFDEDCCHTVVTMWERRTVLIYVWLRMLQIGPNWACD